MLIVHPDSRLLVHILDIFDYQSWQVLKNANKEEGPLRLMVTAQILLRFFPQNPIQNPTCGKRGVHFGSKESTLSSDFSWNARHEHNFRQR